MSTNSMNKVLRTVLAASTLLVAGFASAASTDNYVYLSAGRMEKTLPDGTSAKMWGFCTAATTAVSAPTMPPTLAACGASWLPGPTITVTAGDNLHITLQNNLPVPTSIVVLGQLGGGLGSPVSMDSPSHATQAFTTFTGNASANPAFVPPVQVQRVRSMGTEVAPGATATLDWTGLKPGTYLYETGTMQPLQAPMGLYGVLIVTNGAGSAYPGVSYDADTALLFSEIDPVQNAAVDAAAVAGAGVNTRFNDPSCTATAPCYPAAVNYTPTYFLINGNWYDQTAPQTSEFDVANSPASIYSSGNVLVRLLNAGSRTHVPSIVGLPMSLVAEDGNKAPGNFKVQSEVLLTAGKTHDVLVRPAQGTDTLLGFYGPATYSVFDRQLSLSTGNHSDGGMHGFILVNHAQAGAGVAGNLPTPVIPMAKDDAFKVPYNAVAFSGNVTANDVAVTSVALGTTAPIHGTVALAANGTFTYTPTIGYSGADTFTYIGNGGTAGTATVTLSVATLGTSVPLANPDAYSSNVYGTLTVSRPGVLANDKDDGGYSLTAGTVTANGCGPGLTLHADGSFALTGAASSCSFQYVATNSQGTPSMPATVSVNFPAATGLQVSVVDSVDPTIVVADYRWIIQEDRTFPVNAADVSKTPAVGKRTVGTSFYRSYMPIVASGCVGPISCGSGQSLGSVQIGDSDALALQTTPTQVYFDPSNKHYYISILPGDAATSGHTMSGAQITLDTNGAPTAAVVVKLPPAPLVPAQLSGFIYEDNNPTNGANDGPVEGGLGGFNIILVDPAGRPGDPAGQQTYDAFNMPLTNALLGVPGCPNDLNINTAASTLTNFDVPALAAALMKADPTLTQVQATAQAKAQAVQTSNLVGVIYTCPNDPNVGTPKANAAKYSLAGHFLIKNLTPARYDVIAHPAAARQGAGEVWWQTETLEGTAAQDAFVGIKESVYFQEFGPPGFHTSIGFVNPNHLKSVTGTHSITGQITSQHMSHPSEVTIWDSGSYDLLGSTTCYVALNSQAGNGPAIAATQCAPDGKFTLSNVPVGDYEIKIFDQWLDQIIQTVAVTVSASDLSLTKDMGAIPVLSWFTQYDQNIFLDANKNGVYDKEDTGISNVPLTVRYRDGGISNRTLTDANGNGILVEVFPLFNWYVAEADTTRFKQTGVHVRVDGGGKPDPAGEGKGLWSSTYADGGSSDRVDMPGALSYGLQSFISQRNRVDWGRTPYVANENGGILGSVVYATTRPFDDQRPDVQTLWEPLVPNVTMNLYRKETLADGTPTLTLVDTTQTSSWDRWVNLVYGADNSTYQMGSDYDPTSHVGLRDATGNPAPTNAYPAGKQVNMQCPGQKPDDVFVAYTLGASDLNRCYDGWHDWNQVQAAPYDGRYQFPSAAYVAAHLLTGAQQNAGQTLVSLPTGEYVVEAVTPPGYEIVKEEDKNILTGDAFIAQAPAQFGGLSSVFILPDQATLNNANPNNPSTGDVGFQSNPNTNLGQTRYKAQFPECVGNLHRVPDFLSIFPQAKLVAPFAGMERSLCDRKLVVVNDQMQSAANFFLFTPVPSASQNTGIILNDASSEFNAAAPDFGEKASVPFVPVSHKDFNGHEIARVYSDQWGAYNGLLPSSWLVNPPTPSGYGPNMLISCINDPGPIADPTGTLDPKTGLVRMITDPQYAPEFSNFCYTNPFMPGRTTHLDTPVVPIAAFAGGYNPADCAYPDATPAIARVDGGDIGPYLPATGGTLTIHAIGDQQVPNPGYAGPFASSGPASLRTLTRRYSFGSLQGRVMIGNVDLTSQIASWDDMKITVNVPANTPSGELVVTTASKVSTVDAVTVTIEDRAPTYVRGPAPEGTLPGAIQQAIDSAAPGDLILVDSGTYSELVVMWKPVRLQGVGAASVIINAAKYPTQKLTAWRPLINKLFAIDTRTGNQTGPSQVDPLPGQEITGGIVLLEPSVLGTEEGAGITVLAKNLPASQCLGGALSDQFGRPMTQSNFLCAKSRIDGISVTGGDAGGGIYVNGWAHGLEISNNRVHGNAGSYNGGVRVGVPYLEVTALVTDRRHNVAGFGYDTGVKIHHNAISKNGTVEGPVGAGGAGGGLSICTGTDGYSVDHNWVCGNYGASDGGGIGHIGFSQNGVIANNQVLFNQAFQQTGSTHGGGIVVIGEPSLTGGLTLGTGNLTIDSNLIRGNFAEGGQGGGIRLQAVNGADVIATRSEGENMPRKWHHITISNNMIVDNIAGWAGGGISLADAISTVVDNNTVAANDSVGIAGVVLAGGAKLPSGVNGTPGMGYPQAAGIVSERTTATLLAVLTGGDQRNDAQISNPDLTNNIVWHNRSFFYTGQGSLCVGNSAADVTTLQGALAGPLAMPTNTPAQVLARDSALSAATVGCALGAQATTGAAGAGAKYWDIGVLEDASPTPGIGDSRLHPKYSILSSIAGYDGANNAANNSASDPLLQDISFNGSRVTPEFGTVINPPSVLNLQVAATVDEGNNYVNLRYGPLTTMKPDAASCSATSCSKYVPFGDFHLPVSKDAVSGVVTGSASPAHHQATTLASVTHDFDGDMRPSGPVTAQEVSGYDIGADQIAFASPKMLVSPSPVAFGNVSTQSTKTITVTVTNDIVATANLVLSALPTLNGSAQFTSASTCATGNPGYAAGTSCTVTITYAPTSIGVKTSALNVAAQNAPAQTVAVSGTGVIPTYSIVPNVSTGHGFGTQKVGTQSAAFKFTVSNTSSLATFNAGAELLINGLNKTGGTAANRSQFVLQFGVGDCAVNTPLAAGASCTFSVVFAPISRGAKGSGVLNPGARVGVTTASGINLGFVGSPVWGTGN